MYTVVQSTYECDGKHRIGYGIAVVEMYDDTVVVLKTISDLSSNRQQVASLVACCNDLQLDPIHLQDVIQDFLATV